jgi:hypothetical protein
MHGGLYIEMASFFVSRIVAGAQRDGAVNASGLSAVTPLLVVSKRVSSDGLMVAILIDYCNP